MLADALFDLIINSLDFHWTSFFELRFCFLLCSATFLVTFARVRVF